MKINEKTNPRKAFENFRNELSELKKEIRNGNFTKEEIFKIKSELTDLELQTYLAKFSVQLDILAEENPYLSAKDVLVKMLEPLPSEIKKSHIPPLTKFVLENWEEKPRKLAV